MLKKIAVGLLISSVLLSNPSNFTVLAKTNLEIKIMVNNQEQKAVTSPQIKNGTVFVPVRTIFDILGITYQFDANTKKITAKHDGNSIEMTLNKKDIVINGKKQTLNDAVFSVNGYTLVPLRAIVETFGVNIIWDNKTKTVSLSATKGTLNQISSKPVEIPKQNEVKEYNAYKELVDLSVKYPSQMEDQLLHIIINKKDVSWMPYFTEKSNKSTLQEALETSLLVGNIEAADFILTHYKHKISNTVSVYKGASLFLNSYPGSYVMRYVRIQPNKTVTYNLNKELDDSKKVIDLLVKHGYKPNDIDLMRAASNANQDILYMIEALIGLGLNPNASVPESMSYTENSIWFGTIGKSNHDGVNTPIVVQAYYATVTNQTDDEIRKLATFIRNGASISLFDEAQKKRIAEFTEGKSEFIDIYNLVTK